ncbi:unnamed protein product [Caenorhabditis brenneri]
MTSAQRNPELFHLAVARINPTLDALNNAFAKLNQVVKSRPLVATDALVEGVRSVLIDFVSATTMQMNTGNLDGLLNHLHDATCMTHNVVTYTELIRYENESRGFRVR